MHATAHNERMERPGFDVLGFLAEPGGPASVATVTGRDGTMPPATTSVSFVAPVEIF